MLSIAYDIVSSPLGEWIVEGDGLVVTRVALDGVPCETLKRDPKRLSKIVRELQEYLNGERQRFTIKVQQDGSPFQKKVWSTLQKIPYGTTLSYGDLAIKCGHPNAYRAVGTANACNRVAIFIPCHRVIAAGGKIGGYGWGIWRKQWLIDTERDHKGSK